MNRAVTKQGTDLQDIVRLILDQEVDAGQPAFPIAREWSCITLVHRRIGNATGTPSGMLA